MITIESLMEGNSDNLPFLVKVINTIGEKVLKKNMI